MSATFWSAVTALATVAGVAAILYAGRQLRFGAWLKAQEIWVADDFVGIRRDLFSRLDDLEQPWTPEAKAAGLDACRKLDEFARLAPYLGRRRMLKVWGDPLAKAWLVLEPLVSEEREMTGFQDKWGGFEKAGAAALSVRFYVQEKGRKTDGPGGAEPPLSGPLDEDAGHNSFG